MSAEESQAREKMQMDYGHSSRLMSDDSFAWFLRECIGPKILEEEKAVKSLDTDAEMTKVAKHRLNLLETIRDWVPTKQSDARDALQEPKP